MSHPTWVRGLKQQGLTAIGLAILSHPTWVRGLKQQGLTAIGLAILSHPTWVRGLKHHRRAGQGDAQGVAPYVGAWIETMSVQEAQPY